MATIGFFAYFDRGDLNAGLKLARALERRGHQVFYLGFCDSERYLREQGFRYQPLFERHFPVGSYREMLSDNALGLGVLKLRRMRRWARRFGEFCDELTSATGDELRGALRALQPDLLVLPGGDEFSSWPACIAAHEGVRSVYLLSALTPKPAGPVPPIETPIIPSATPWSRARVALAWHKRLCSLRARARVCALLGLDTDLARVTEQLIAHYGPLPALPELIPWPEELELPGYASPGRHYIESAIDTSRTQQAFDFDKLDARPLVYCALGTIPWFDAATYRRFFQVIVDVAAQRCDWQWVIATGGMVPAAALERVGSHVLLTEHAPQLALLERAHFMIGHAGTNTIKECVHFGVPMIVYPLGADQPGNAARVVYHGIGLRGRIEHITEESLNAKIDALQSSVRIQSQIRLTQERTRARELAQPGVALIEGWLGDSTRAQRGELHGPGYV